MRFTGIIMRPLRFIASETGFVSLIYFSLIIIGCTPNGMESAAIPEVLDDRLRLELVDASPNIRTPIGLTVDSKDQIYILESHTHTPPSDYAGPKYDRIKRGVDRDKDGKPEAWIIFADSLNDGMNLACDQNDVIYLATKDRILSFRDTNQDGVSDERTTLLSMTASGNIYDHAGILGLTVSPDNQHLYISRGNTGGQAWKIEGADGAYVEGYGDGGNIMRCRLDGSQIEEVATGFWNPFDLKFTQEGRLLATDNDPDSRGPNRLLEIVAGGDYGYKSLYGGSGIHPFLAWNGELPGTLSYAAALGEAPSGLVDATNSNFPAEYRSNILAAIWEENTIVRISLREKGGALVGETQILIQGDSTFHPVALAANSKGDIYMTDWVVRTYPNHGEGKLWRLSAGGNRPMENQGRSNGQKPKNGGPFLARDIPLDNLDQIKTALRSDDVFLQTLARRALVHSSFRLDLTALTKDADPVIRLQAILALTKTDLEIDAQALKRLLRDENEKIRRMALIYAALKTREDLYPEVDRLLYSGHISPALFETYLATVRHLQTEFIQAYRGKLKTSSNKLERKLPPGYLLSIIQNDRLPVEIRSAALPYLDNPATHLSALTKMLENAPQSMQMALLQALRLINDQNAAKTILKIALDPKKESVLRAQAIIALEYQSHNFCGDIRPLLKEENELVAERAVAYICRCQNEEAIKTALNQYVQNKTSALREIWDLCGGRQSEGRPQNDAQWAQSVDETGNAEKGRFVFQSARAQCLRCHQVNGWGGGLGPDLSNIGSSKSREQLISAILEPSLEISPEWQGWFVTTQEGETHYGRQIDVGLHNVELLTPADSFVTYIKPKDYGLAPYSLMQEGLETMLTKSEFNDLIAYLTTLK